MYMYQSAIPNSTCQLRTNLHCRLYLYAMHKDLEFTIHKLLKGSSSKKGYPSMHWLLLEGFLSQQIYHNGYSYSYKSILKRKYLHHTVYMYQVGPSMTF